MYSTLSKGATQYDREKVYNPTSNIRNPKLQIKGTAETKEKEIIRHPPPIPLTQGGSSKGNQQFHKNTSKISKPK